MRINKKKRNLLIFFIIQIILSLIFWFFGFLTNLNNFILIETIIANLFIFKYSNHFFIKNIYIILAYSIYYIGVFACETSQIYLIELSTYTSYSNSFSLATVVMWLLYGSIFYFEKDKKNQQLSQTEELKNNNKMNFPYILSIFVIFLELIVARELITNGASSAMGISRALYGRTVMSVFSQTLKANLILFLPVFRFSEGKFKKLLFYFYVGLFLFILFWSGEKYTPYVRLGYLLLLMYPSIFRTISKKIYIVALIFLMLIGVVYYQYYHIYQSSLYEFLAYLLSRLAQQGQVWWSVCGLEYELKNISEFLYEIKACFNSSLSTTNPFAGQWKMMYIAAHGSSYVVDRIANMYPYTSTTFASALYYFGHIGLFITVPILGRLYCFAVDKLIPNMKSNNLIISILFLKVFLMIDSLITASDIQSLLSFKGLFIVLICLIIPQMRLKKIGEVK